MPTPARTSIEEIVAAGRRVVATDGLDGLTMQRVAELAGVRAPSLYKRVPSRAALVRLVAEDLLRDLRAALVSAAGSGDDQLRQLAVAFREFALAEPGVLALVFAPLPTAMAPSPQALAVAAEPVLKVAGQLVGDEQALAAARTITAWATGFVRMELQGSFELGGSVPRAFDYGIQALALGLAASRPPTPGS